MRRRKTAWARSPSAMVALGQTWSCVWFRKTSTCRATANQPGLTGPPWLFASDGIATVPPVNCIWVKYSLQGDGDYCIKKTVRCFVFNVGILPILRGVVAIPPPVFEKRAVYAGSHVQKKGWKQVAKLEK